MSFHFQQRRGRDRNHSIIKIGPEGTEPRKRERRKGVRDGRMDRWTEGGNEEGIYAFPVKLVARRVSNPSRCQRVYLPQEEDELSSALSLSLLLGKAPVSCLVRIGWLSSTLCAPNSDSKKEKEKSRPGKDGNIHGPLESEGLLIKMVRMDWVAHGSFQWTSLWVGDGDSPFLGSRFHVGFLCKEDLTSVGPWRGSNCNANEWMWESCPREPEEQT